MTRLAKYPIFVLEKDDRSFHKIDSPTGLDWFERIDIEDGLYCGWDSDAQYFDLVWDKPTHRPTLALHDRDPEGFNSEAVAYEHGYALAKKKASLLARGKV